MKTGGQKGGTVPAHDLAELRDDVGGEHRVALLAVVSVAAVVLAFAVAVPGRALLAAIDFTAPPPIQHTPRHRPRLRLRLRLSSEKKQKQKQLKKNIISDSLAIPYSWY